MAKKHSVITLNNVEFRIEQLENRSIQIVPNKNMTATLRDISKLVGFNLEEKWDGFQIGAKLIDFINNLEKPATTEKENAMENNVTNVTVVEDASEYKFYRAYDFGMTKEEYDILSDGYDEDDEAETKRYTDLMKKYGLSEDDIPNLGLVSNHAWEWWKNLSDSMKFILLCNYKDTDAFEDVDLEMPYFVEEALREENDEEAERVDFAADEMRDAVGYMMTDFFAETTELDITDLAEYSDYADPSLHYVFNGLEYLPCLEEISLRKSEYLLWFPKEFVNFKHLKRLDLSRTECGGEELEQDIETLFNFAKAHPEMERIDLSGTFLADALDSEKLAELQKLMPKCEIEV